MYKVNEHTFNSFYDVAQWAWNTHKIDFVSDEVLTEQQKLEACRELEQLIKED